MHLNAHPLAASSGPQSTTAVTDEVHSDVRRLCVAGVIGAVASGSAVALLGTAAWLIAQAAQAPPVLTLTVAAVMVRTFALTRALGRYIERLVGHDAAFRQLTEERVRIYRRLEVLSPVGLARFGQGDVLARLVGDVDSLMDRTLRVWLPWIQGILVSVATVVAVAWLLPSAGWVMAGALLLGLAGVPALAAWVSSRAERRLAPARGELTDAVVSTLRAAPDLVAFGAGPAMLETIAGRDHELTRLAARESTGLGASAGLGVLIQGAAVVLCLMAAIPAVTSGNLPLVWLAVIGLLPLAAYDVIMTLPTAALTALRVQGSHQRLAEVLTTPDPVHEPRHAVRWPDSPPEVRLRGVSARWSAKGPVTLAEINLDLAPGECVAVVGPSGAGKSTLAAVLLRFLDYAGSAQIAGVELADMPCDSVREHIGLLSQDSHIFATTIADNLRLARPDALDHELQAVLDHVRLGPWLAEQPDGLNTRMVETGMSGGERQRLALARLLLADRPVIVLDEPTEHLDPMTAESLMSDLMSLRASGRSILLITHRLMEAERADRVVVLTAGEVIASGSPENVRRDCPWYAERLAAEVDRHILMS